MAQKNPEERPKGGPSKGIDPKTEKPYAPITREDWDKLLKRAAKSKG